MAQLGRYASRQVIVVEGQRQQTAQIAQLGRQRSPQVVAVERQMSDAAVGVSGNAVPIAQRVVALPAGIIVPGVAAGGVVQGDQRRPIRSDVLGLNRSDSDVGLPTHLGRYHSRQVVIERQSSDAAGGVGGNAMPISERGVALPAGVIVPSGAVQGDRRRPIRSDILRLNRSYLGVGLEVDQPGRERDGGDGGNRQGH